MQSLSAVFPCENELRISVFLPPKSGGGLGSSETKVFIFMKAMQHLVSSHVAV